MGTPFLLPNARNARNANARVNILELKNNKVTYIIIAN